MNTGKPRITIEYCPKCNWLLRSAWMAQEILNTFAENVGEVALIPSETGGKFEIYAGEQRIWSRPDDGGFPDVKQLKQRIRDAVAPERELGHVDRKDERE